MRLTDFRPQIACQNFHQRLAVESPSGCEGASWANLRGRKQFGNRSHMVTMKVVRGSIPRMVENPKTIFIYIYIYDIVIKSIESH